MSQILRPISDILINGFTPFPASPTTLFDKIDDGGGITDDGGTISSDAGTFIEQEYSCGITAGSVPATPGTCTVFLTVAKDTGSSALQDVLVEVREGATTRASRTFTTITSIATELSFTFSSSAIVSSWSTLRLYFQRLATGTSCFITLYNTRLVAPDPGFPHAVVSGTGLVIAAAGSGSYLVGSGSGLQRIDGLEVAGAILGGSGSGLLVS